MNDLNELAELLSDILETSIIDAEGFLSSQEGRKLVQELDELVERGEALGCTDPDSQEILDTAYQVQEGLNEMTIAQQGPDWAPPYEEYMLTGTILA